ncbi:MAG: radical SAM protein [Desulfobacterales bacterium]|nr:MAG: radical SAM protein [Desulfobacterales bacterium]
MSAPAPRPQHPGRTEDFWRKAGILVQHQLENLLRIIDPEVNGEVVAIDELRVGVNGSPWEPSPAKRRRAQGKGKVVYEILSAYKPQEPRLLMIEAFLRRLLRLAEIRFRGNRVNVDSFRLKNLNAWARYPHPRLLDNFGEICSRCSCDCEVCFLKGSALAYTKKAMLTVGEAQTRARYYSPRRRKGLPVPHGWPGEPFLNPRILEILEIARRAQPRHLLDITTNGDFLTAPVIERLARLKPISLVVSINSADPATRRGIMRSKHPATAIRAIPLLKEAGIQFVGSVVPTATLPVEDIAATVGYLDRHNALQIRILLPGFTRFHAPRLAFDSRPRWDAIVELAQDLRSKLSTPIVIQPSYYWNRDISAVIDGVYRNSPAQRAGLRFGDRIVAIDGKPIITKAEASDLLRLSPAEALAGDGFRRSLKAERHGRIMTVELMDDASETDDFYPYKPRGYSLCDSSFKGHGLGIHLIDGFRLESLQAFEACIRKHPNAKKVLLYTTPLVKDLLSQAVMIMGKAGELAGHGVEIRVTMAEQRFWGGNIVVGDLHVVQDYLDHLAVLKNCGYVPDLIVIPGSFVNEWGFDVMGRSYTDIARQTGIRLELLTNVRVMM